MALFYPFSLFLRKSYYCRLQHQLPRFLMVATWVDNTKSLELVCINLCHSERSEESPIEILRGAQDDRNAQSTYGFGINAES